MADTNSSIPTPHASSGDKDIAGTEIPPTDTSSVVQKGTPPTRDLFGEKDKEKGPAKKQGAKSGKPLFGPSTLGKTAPTSTSFFATHFDAFSSRGTATSSPLNIACQPDSRNWAYAITAFIIAYNGKLSLDGYVYGTPHAWIAYMMILSFGRLFWYDATSRSPSKYARDILNDQNLMQIFEAMKDCDIPADFGEFFFNIKPSRGPSAMDVHITPSLGLFEPNLDLFRMMHPLIYMMAHNNLVVHSDNMRTMMDFYNESVFTYTGTNNSYPKDFIVNMFAHRFSDATGTAPDIQINEHDNWLARSLDKIVLPYTQRSQLRRQLFSTFTINKPAITTFNDSVSFNPYVFYCCLLPNQQQQTRALLSDLHNFTSNNFERTIDLNMTLDRPGNLGSQQYALFPATLPVSSPYGVKAKTVSAHRTSPDKFTIVEQTYEQTAAKLKFGQDWVNTGTDTLTYPDKDDNLMSDLYLVSKNKTSTDKPEFVHQTKLTYEKAVNEQIYVITPTVDEELNSARVLLSGILIENGNVDGIIHPPLDPRYSPKYNRNTILEYGISASRIIPYAYNTHDRSAYLRSKVRMTSENRAGKSIAALFTRMKILVPRFLADSVAHATLINYDVENNHTGSSPPFNLIKTGDKTTNESRSVDLWSSYRFSEQGKPPYEAWIYLLPSLELFFGWHRGQVQTEQLYKIHPL
nr:MAG: coat protein [Flammulina betapartitivirus 1]